MFSFQLSISITIVSRAVAHGRSHFNVDFHRTGRLPCVQIEVDGVNVHATINNNHIIIL